MSAQVQYLTPPEFEAILQKVLDAKTTSVIDTTVEPLCFGTKDPPSVAWLPTARQAQILFQIYAIGDFDVKWLIAAYHLRDVEKYTATRQWLVQHNRTDMIPDLGEPYKDKQ